MNSGSAKTLTHSCASATSPDSCEEFAGRRVLWLHTGASPLKGFGHLRRSLVLASLLSEAPDLEVVFVLAGHDQWSAPQVDVGGYSVIRIDEVRPWPPGEIPCGLVIDIRGEEASRLLAVEAKRRGIPVLSIHDLGLELLPSDVVVDGSVAPGTFSAGYAGIQHCGLSYLVLDPAFAAVNVRGRNPRREIHRVVIALGGGDAGASFLHRILEGLRLWGREADVVGMRGFCEWGQADPATVDWSPVRFRWAEREVSIPELLHGADLVFAAGGMALYESMCAGAPVAAVACDSFQQITVASLARLGACLDLGIGTQLEPPALARMLSNLEEDLEGRARFSRRGRELVDGTGAQRVAQLVREMTALRERQ